MIKLLSDRAPAKINLVLRITGRRADGYHELDSVFVPLSLADRIALEMRPAALPTVELDCNWPSLGAPEQNLAVRAASAFMADTGVTAAVTIDLHKAIPAGAGLGGGSSDAAAVLRMMAQLNRIDDPPRLARLALALGADVPFFLTPQAARVRGIGELIEPLDGFAALSLVIAVPAVNVPTAAVFKQLRRDQWSGPLPAADLADLRAGRIRPELLVNDLAPVAIALWPAIADLKKLLEDCGARGAAMSGSGGAVFGIFATAAQAASAVGEVQRRAPAAQVFAVSTLA